MPPTSMHAPHEQGIERSPKRLASPMAIMIRTGCGRWAGKRKTTPASVNPVKARMRRACARLPVARASRAVRNPEMRFPNPPPKRGIPARSASAYWPVVEP